MIDREGLKVAAVLDRFIEQHALPGTGIALQPFWRAVAALFARLAPENRALLASRDAMQQRIDDWHRQHPGAIGDQATYQSMRAGAVSTMRCTAPTHCSTGPQPPGATMRRAVLR